LITERTVAAAQAGAAANADAIANSTLARPNQLEHHPALARANEPAPPLANQPDPALARANEPALAHANQLEPAAARANEPALARASQPDPALAHANQPEPAAARPDEPALARLNEHDPALARASQLDPALARANKPALARANEFAPLTAAQRYQVQFTATQEYVDLVERAQALLGRSAHQALAELHMQAMRALVAQLEKRKYAVIDTGVRGRERGDVVGDAGDVAGEGERGGVQDRVPRRRGRYIPAALRREVFLRDGQRCTFVDDETGERCRQTRRLEFHHLDPFARGGVHSASNLTLRCHAHNRLAAEQDFGKQHMSKCSEGAAHEAFSRQRLPHDTGLPVGSSLLGNSSDLPNRDP
jgi:hypothetical protein